MRYASCVIGAGIVGLATALAILRRRPGESLIVLEKEHDIAVHQSGRNSGVIHAGIYYAPGTLKAALCREGNVATKAFCDDAGVPYETCGKLVVATDARELARMEDLHARALENGIEVTRLTGGALREIEPNVTGLGALLVRSTGIVDYRKVAGAMADAVRRAGGEIRFAVEVDAIRESGGEVAIRTAGGESWQAERLVACAGLQSDRLARIAGFAPDFRIVPFRGEYFALPRERSGFVRHLIYPVPDPALPFLGIHLTRMADGGITVGPNAVLGFAREGYPRLSIAPGDLADYFAFIGFWRMLKANWQSGMTEMRRSLSRGAFLSECQKYVPGLRAADLLPHPTGIRAQAVGRDGGLVHDFLMLRSARMLHVCNAPSPAATSALPIGRLIAERLDA